MAKAEVERAIEPSSAALAARTTGFRVFLDMVWLPLGLLAVMRVGPRV